MQSLFPAPPETPRFLRLPLEIRQNIYRYVLPSTISLDVRLQRGSDSSSEKPEYNLTFIRQASGPGVWRMQKTSPKADRSTGNDIVWLRGCTALLAANRQLHEECANLMYGDSVFVVDVTFDSISFRHRWRTSNHLTPSRDYMFLEHFSQRNLLRIRNYIINVESVDDYTGMIKYNCGGRGLPAGIRAKAQELVDLLAVVPYLHRLQVHLIDGAISRVRFPSGRVHRVQDEKNYAQTQTVLDPFHALYNVRRAKVTGVSTEYAEALERSMTAPRGVPQA